MVQSAFGGLCTCEMAHDGSLMGVPLNIQFAVSSMGKEMLQKRCFPSAKESTEQCNLHDACWRQ